MWIYSVYVTKCFTYYIIIIYQLYIADASERKYSILYATDIGL